jgi:hypothetical protein
MKDPLLLPKDPVLLTPRKFGASLGTGPSRLAASLWRGSRSHGGKMTT